MIVEEKAFGVVVVIKEEEYKFLILLQDKKWDNWSFPKGKQEEGETPIETAMRELREEVNIVDIEILDFPMIEEKYEIQKPDKLKKRENKYFIGIVKDKNLKLKEDEIFEYKWATYEEARNTFVFQKEHKIKVLEQARKYLEEYERRK